MEDKLYELMNRREALEERAAEESVRLVEYRAYFKSGALALEDLLEQCDKVGRLRGRIALLTAEIENALKILKR